MEGPEGAYKKIVADPAGMDELLLEVFVEAHPEPPEEVILDVDATDDPLHGKQEGRFFHGYYKRLNLLLPDCDGSMARPTGVANP